MSNSTQTRRRFLVGTAGTTLVLGLAGCVSVGGSDTGNDETETEHHDDQTEHHGDETEHHDETETEHHDNQTEHHDDQTEHHDETETEHHGDETDSHGHNHDEGTPEGPSETERVMMRTEGSQQHYDPHIAWVETGGTVTWELESGQHNAVAYHPDNDKPRRIPEGAASWDTEMLSESGATASHTFETEGVYDYYCAPHEALGMVGTVIVGEPDAHDQPALEPPQDSLPEGARTELADLAEQVKEALGHTH